MMWFYNEGGNHRGVWHLAKKPLTIIDVPETTSDSQFSVPHDLICKAGKWDWNHSYSCTCGAQGKKYTSSTTYPSHQEYEPLDSACGQVRKYMVNSTSGDWTPQVWVGSPRSVGSVVSQTRIYPDGPTLKDWVLVSDTRTAGPNCTRCIKKEDAGGE